ncbi:MAG TPA: DUF2232 domain-containing protein [Turneriella sp.]|nr:DUF2232 domain-containing protein [Turneriella sp.]
MELLLGFPLSLVFTLIPLYFFREKIPRKLWLIGVFACTSLFFLLPHAWRLQSFLPGGAALFFLITGVWVLMLNPQNTILKLLGIPLPSRAELKAEIEKVPDVENRLRKYFTLTEQLKKIWEKRDAFLSGANSVLLLFFTLVSAILSFAMAFQDYQSVGILKVTIDGVQEQINARLTEAGASAIDIHAQIVGMSPTIIFVLSFFSIYCLGIFLRIFARIRFKQNIIHGQLNLFRLSDSWVWVLIVFAGLYVLGFKNSKLEAIEFYTKNGLWILLFLYMLQGMGIISLFFEVRLLPVNWLIFTLLITSILLPGIFLIFAAIFAVIGLMEVWLGLRKRSLRSINNLENS